MAGRRRYSFDDHPQDRDRLTGWAQQWIGNALSTEPADRPRMRAAMAGLYEAAGLAPPARGVFVASPLTAAIAGSVAAGVWWLREHPEQHAALFGRRLSEVELMAAIPVACARAVAAGAAVLRGETPPVPALPATAAATAAATHAATDAATDAATAAATDAATHAATDAATRAATAAATHAATAAATRDVAAFLVRCTTGWNRMHDGGSDWSAWPAYLSFFRHVARLDIDYDKWRHYEDAARHGASRIMHTRFWLVADRHTTLRMDEQARLHCPDGPARAWGDGWALYYWHGTRVPADLIETGWDTTRILREPNAEVRRSAIERMGWDRFVADAGLAMVGEPVPDPGNPGHELALYDVPERIYGDADVRVLVCTNGTVERDGTRRRFGLTTPADIPDPLTAAAWTYNDPDHPVQVTPELYSSIQRRT